MNDRVYRSNIKQCSLTGDRDRDRDSNRFPPKVLFVSLALCLGLGLTGCGGAGGGSGAETDATADQDSALGVVINTTARNHLAPASLTPSAVQLYQHPGFGGTTELFGPGIYSYGKRIDTVDAFAKLANDDASSMKVGAGATALVCEHFNVSSATVPADLGHCVVFTAGQSPSDLRVQGFDDKTSAVVVTAGKSARPQVGLVAWADGNYAGAQQSFVGGGFDASDIGSGVGNDAISSIEVKPGFIGVLCTNGIGHAQTPASGQVPIGTDCKSFPAGKYAAMPAGLNDIVSMISVLPIATNPAVVGQFSAVKDWPFAPIHQYLLADGRVMANEESPDDGNPSTGEYMVWDPATDQVTTGSLFADIGANLFCSANVHLPNGDLIAAAAGGGGKTVNRVLRYDTATDRWESAPSMKWKRYYPSAAVTSRGTVLVAGGNDVFGFEYGGGAIKTPELFDNSAWRDLPGAQINFGNHRGSTTDSSFWAWMQTAPNGRMFMAGPEDSMRYIDIDGAGAVQELGARDSIFRSYGSYATYAPGKMLVAGGGNSTNTAKIVHFDGQSAQVSAAAPMNHGRRQHNMTLLANGEVFVSGGNSDGQETFSESGAVYSTEVWNPASQTWRITADLLKSRQYHSTALLIPDGRVVVGGQCAGPPCNKNIEVFSPPYMFSANGTPAVRPAITRVADQWRYGSRLPVTYTGAGVTKAHLIKLGAVTHSTNFEQRLVPLTIAANSGTQLQVDAPVNSNTAPPGHYMLVLVNSRGVPSVAKIIQVTGNVAALGTATQSSTFGGDGYPAQNSIDGHLDTFSHTATNDTSSAWTLQWNSDQSIGQVALHNRAGYGQRLRDIKVTIYNAAGQAVYTSPVLNPGNAMKSPKRLELDLHRLGVGSVTGRKIVVQRLPDPSLSGGPGDNADGASTLTLTEVQVFAGNGL